MCCWARTHFLSSFPERFERAQPVPPVPCAPISDGLRQVASRAQWDTSAERSMSTSSPPRMTRYCTSKSSSSGPPKHSAQNMTKHRANRRLMSVPSPCWWKQLNGPATGTRRGCSGRTIMWNSQTAVLPLKNACKQRSVS